MFHFVEKNSKKGIFKRLVNASWGFKQLLQSKIQHGDVGFVVPKDILFYNIFSGAFVKRAKLRGDFCKSACVR
jgi:hypothetical protein